MCLRKVGTYAILYWALFSFRLDPCTVATFAQPPPHPSQPTDRFVSSTLCSIHQQGFFFTPDKLVQSRHEQHCPKICYSDWGIGKLRSTRIASPVFSEYRCARREGIAVFRDVTSGMQSSPFKFIITEPIRSKGHQIIFPNYAVRHSFRKPQTRGPCLKPQDLAILTSSLSHWLIRTDAWEFSNKIMLVLLPMTFPFTLSSAIRGGGADKVLAL
jgi:hypothetical protein